MKLLVHQVHQDVGIQFRWMRAWSLSSSHHELRRCLDLLTGNAVASQRSLHSELLIADTALAYVEAGASGEDTY